MSETFEVLKRFAAHGFRLEHTGGGCTAFVRRSHDGIVEMVTRTKRASAPLALSNECMLVTYENEEADPPAEPDATTTCAAMLDALESKVPAVEEYSLLSLRLNALEMRA